MLKDKSIVSFPSTSKTSIVPNTATNYSRITYNEGIYLSDSSLSATYPKSLVRFYKNPSNPKKVYFIGKDTSLLENFVLNLIDKNLADIDTSVGSVATEPEEYYWTRTNDDSYQDFAIFSQPSNLNLDVDVKGKTINFYNLPILSSDISYLSSLNASSDVNNYFFDYGMFLKAKSSITDYENYDLYKFNKFIELSIGAASGTRYEKVSFLNKVGLYEKFLFSEFASSVDVENEFSKIKPLYDTDLELKNKTSIVNVNKIKFSDFISNSYSDFVIQKIIKDEEGDLTGGENSVENTYVIWKFASNTDTGPKIINYDSYEGNADVGFPDGVSITSLYDKAIYIIKDNDSISTIKDFEVIDYTLAASTRSVQTQLFDINHYDVGYRGDTIIENLTINGALVNENYKRQFFSIDKKINLDNYIYYTDESFPREIDDQGTTRTGDDVLYPVPVDFSGVNKSEFYIFNDSFKYIDFGFVPTNVEETIYEFELDQEIDIPNGSFIVAEIQ